MKKARKALLTLCAALLLVTMTAGITVAYLTSTTGVVTNTFTVGNVKITLDEAPVDGNGKKTTGDRVKANTYKLLPGHEYDKDPTVHVDATSEEAWLFVKITNDIVGIEDTTTIAEQMAANSNWTLVSNTTNVYAYKTTVKGGENIVVFDGFKIKGDVKNEALAEFEGKTITVQAYAVQKDGFNTAEAAWAAAPSDWTVPATGN